MEIDLDLLATVTGAGDSTTEVNAGPIQYRSSTTDYATCVGTVRDMTAAQYPSTRPWYNPFASDANASPRAQATMDNIRSVCGPAPQN